MPKTGGLISKFRICIFYSTQMRHVSPAWYLPGECSSAEENMGLIAGCLFITEPRLTNVMFTFLFLNHVSIYVVHKLLYFYTVLEYFRLLSNTFVVKKNSLVNMVMWLKGGNIQFEIVSWDSVYVSYFFGTRDWKWKKVELTFTSFID